MTGPPRAAEQAGYREVFASAEFRALWGAQLLSVAGDQLARVALTVLVYDRTRSPLLASLTYAASIAPLFLGGVLLAGMADRWPRRNVMIGCDLLRIPLAAVMAIPGMPLPALLGLLCALTALAGPFSAARSAVLPQVLGSSYTFGTAITMTTYQLAQALGFLAGGAITGLAGSRSALLADAATFAASAGLITLRVRARPVPRGARASPGATTAAAIRLVTANRAVRTPMLIGWLTAFYNTPEGLAAPLAQACRAGALGVGSILAAGALGASAGALVLPRVAGPAAIQRLMPPLAITACGVLITMGLRPGLPAVLAIVLISGICDCCQVPANAQFVTSVPDSLRGRAFGIALGGMQLGQGAAMVIAGAIAAHLGPWVTIAGAGALGAAAAVLITLG